MVMGLGGLSETINKVENPGVRPWQDWGKGGMNGRKILLLQQWEHSKNLLRAISCGSGSSRYAGTADAIPVCSLFL